MRGSADKRGKDADIRANFNHYVVIVNTRLDEFEQFALVVEMSSEKYLKIEFVKVWTQPNFGRASQNNCSRAQGDFRPAYRVNAVAQLLSCFAGKPLRKHR